MIWSGRNFRQQYLRVVPLTVMGFLNLAVEENCVPRNPAKHSEHP
jgi:hypothetical protein